MLRIKAVPDVLICKTNLTCSTPPINYEMRTFECWVNEDVGIWQCNTSLCVFLLYPNARCKSGAGVGMGVNWDTSDAASIEGQNYLKNKQLTHINAGLLDFSLCWLRCRGTVFVCQWLSGCFFPTLLHVSAHFLPILVLPIALSVSKPSLLWYVPKAWRRIKMALLWVGITA